MAKSIVAAGAMLATLLLAACQAPQDTPLLSKKPAVELRAMQARVFETSDHNRVLRATIATMQDLGYTLDKVRASSGTVSGTKLALLKMSASVYPHGETQTVVRVDAAIHVPPHWQQVDALEFYQQDFFDPLSKVMFLQPHSASTEDQSAGPSSMRQPAPDSIEPTS